MHQIKPHRVHARRGIKLGPGGDVQTAFREAVEGVGSDDLGGDVFVDDLVHKARVRTVFQQASHKIGQQIGMCAHGGVDATMGAMLVHHDVMKGFAHAVQTLEFELLFILGHMQYGGDRMRVMCGELRIDPVGHVQQFARVGDIGHIGRGFLGEDGETFDTFDLCAFDLGVPVGAFHQADH